MRKTKGKNGITLMALVITIIILLILAGIAISSLTQTGLFSKAQEAKQKTEEKTEEENTTLNEYEKWIAKYENNGYKGQPITNVDTSKTNPEGAMPKGATVIEGNGDEGIVIKDSNDNEWVWVEVQKNITEGYTYNRDIEKALQKYAGDYKEGQTDWTDEWYAEDGNNLVTASTADLTTEQKALKNGCGLTYDEYNTAKSKMLQSIKTNGGFWISRYEAGISGTNTDATSDEIQNVRYSHSDITKDSPKAVSQADRIPYNWVTCSEAQTLASAMSTDSNKTSSLLFGIQWDLACKFIETKANLPEKDIKTDSTIWGNYKNCSITLTRGRYNVSPADSSSVWKKFSVDTNYYVTKSQISSNESYTQLLTTGASEDAKKMNIYDFAGNMWEWTLEKTFKNNYPCANRGGSFVYSGSDYPASYRDAYSIIDSYADFGFRSTLY